MRQIKQRKVLQNINTTTKIVNLLQVTPKKRKKLVNRTISQTIVRYNLPLKQELIKI